MLLRLARGRSGRGEFLGLGRNLTIFGLPSKCYGLALIIGFAGSDVQLAGSDVRLAGSDVIIGLSGLRM